MSRRRSLRRTRRGFVAQRPGWHPPLRRFYLRRWRDGRWIAEPGAWVCSGPDVWTRV